MSSLPSVPDAAGLAERAWEQSAGDLVGALYEVQAAAGYLPRDVLMSLAECSGVGIARLFGVATFYDSLHLEPRGDTIVRVCHGTACHVLGAHRITDRLAAHLDIEPGGTTDDRRYTLESVACVGCCSLAPVVVVGEQTLGRLSPKNVETILLPVGGGDS